ncbi:hypothetical protein KS4_29590 [Poriferisphaera corsica]|uniref:Uncharacterized protein n=1 Tax=Poriferisphaera corsica TaxID=2528020 RepID=A0A517YXF2_9BACT|nr:hypothetical protein [Poriferisphaera corsica]QDU34883.1 hypothetical protein KS4_29590 [Poriferisphaera corsica]
MNRRSLAALIILNTLLIVAIVMASFTAQPTVAQSFGSDGENYTMLSGPIQGRSQNDGIYIIDVQKGNVIAAYFDGSSKKFVVIKGTNVPADLRKEETRR